MMRKLTLLVLLVVFSMASAGANAASYLRTDGVVVDPIQLRSSNGNHPYSGANLEPFAELENADLWNAVLHDADLAYANLRGANLNGAHLENSSLVGTILVGANFGASDLTDSNLMGARLNGAYLDGAGLSSASLREADLEGASLRYAYVNSADLTEARLLGTSLHGVEFLANTVGLPYYDALTDFTDTWFGASGSSSPFDPVAAGWTLIPEPSTALLLGLGLVGMAARRRV
jgi:hypothetical protein